MADFESTQIIPGVTKLKGKVLLSGCVYNTALAMPAIQATPPDTATATGIAAVDSQDRGVLLLTFAGADADGETFSYQVVGLQIAEAPYGGAGKGGYVPVKLAEGVVTLGSKAVGTNGTFIDENSVAGDGTDVFMADTITETLASQRARLYSPAGGDDTAVLAIDVSEFRHVYTQVSRNGKTAARMDVIANLGDLAAGTSFFDADVTLGAVTVTSGNITEDNSATIAGDTTSMDSKMPAKGAAAAAASTPVTLATEDAAKVPALGAAAAAASTPVTLSTEDAAKVPALGGAAAASATPVTLSTEDAAKVAALGTAAMAASTPVTIATDDTVAKALGVSTVAPTVDSYGGVAVDCAANTDNQELIATPGANKQIWVYGMLGGGSVAAGTIQLLDDADAAHTGSIPVGVNGGFSHPESGNFAMPWFKVATNKALDMKTVTCAFDGNMSYAIVSV